MKPIRSMMIGAVKLCRLGVIEDTVSIHATVFKGFLSCCSEVSIESSKERGGSVEIQGSTLNNI